MAQTVLPGEASEARPGLRRDIGFIGLLFISLGSIIGSGWLLGAFLAAQSAGAASIVSYALAGVVIALLALVHAELGAAYPLAGGTGQWPRWVFGSMGGFTAGWVAWLQAVTIAPIEVEAALGYLDHQWHGLIKTTGALSAQGLGIAAALMLLFTVINLLGVRWLAKTNEIAVAWKIAVPVLTIGVLMVFSFHASNFTAGGGFALYGVHGIFAALSLGVVFSLQGFEQAVQIAGEARDPQRNVPRAVIFAVVTGTLLYLLLEVAFVGALNPTNLIHGWANPVSKGDFGPYVTLATGLGLGWLAVILYVDAFISPADTGLVYVGTSARLAYALGHSGYVPRGFSAISSRDVPWCSVILAFVVGLICFLPFPSWRSLIGLVTDATVIMYAFAPISLAALRKADPDRSRPFKLWAAGILAPLAFIVTNEIIYWTSWGTVWKLMLAIVAGYALFGIFFVVGRPMERPPLDPQSLLWIVPWFTGLAVISYLGQYGGTKLIPEWYDLGVVAAFSLVIFFVAVGLRRSAEEVVAAVEDELKTSEAAHSS